MTQQNKNPQQDEVAGPRRGTGQNRRRRLYAIEYRWFLWSWEGWRLHGRYRTAEERDTALEGLQRKHSALRVQYRPLDLGIEEA